MPEEKQRKSIRVGEIDKMIDNTCSRWKGLTSTCRVLQE